MRGRATIEVRHVRHMMININLPGASLDFQLSLCPRRTLVQSALQSEVDEDPRFSKAK